MKDFQDFINRLDSETVDTIVTSASNASGSLEEREPFMISLKLLQMYHDWLHDNTLESDQ